MIDPIFESFLAAERRAGLALAGQSDLLVLQPLDGPPTQRYVAIYRCEGLTHEGDQVVQGDHWMFHINLHDGYLRRVDTRRVLTVLTPLFHPNVYGPLICLGRGIRPGMSLTDLLFQIYEIISYQNFSPHDGLNEQACAWARQHMDRFPIDDRPLKTRLTDAGPSQAT